VGRRLPATLNNDGTETTMESPIEWQAEIDALIDDTRKHVAMPTDGCVITSLAAQVLLARRENTELRKENRRLTQGIAELPQRIIAEIDRRGL
jgi:hypothetical protein